MFTHMYMIMSIKTYFGYIYLCMENGKIIPLNCTLPIQCVPFIFIKFGRRFWNLRGHRFERRKCRQKRLYCFNIWNFWNIDWKMQMSKRAKSWLCVPGWCQLLRTIVESVSNFALDNVLMNQTETTLTRKVISFFFKLNIEGFHQGDQIKSPKM
jgi:hypothetical protein